MTEQQLDTLVRRIETLETRVENQQKQINQLLNENVEIRRDLYTLQKSNAELQLGRLEQFGRTASITKALREQVVELGGVPVA